MKQKIKKKVSNKLFYTLLILSVVLLLGVGVYAFGTIDASVFGHTASEVQIVVEGKTETIQEAINNLDLTSGLFFSSNENVTLKYIKGNNVNCPSNYEYFLRKWNSKTCDVYGSYYNGGGCYNSCITNLGWGGEKTCWVSSKPGYCSSSGSLCMADSWSEAICIKIN